MEVASVVLPLPASPATRAMGGRGVVCLSDAPAALRSRCTARANHSLAALPPSWILASGAWSGMALGVSTRGRRFARSRTDSSSETSPAMEKREKRLSRKRR